MKRRMVVLSPEALDDLLQIYEWIALATSPQIAIAYIERIEAYCLGLDMASERGHRRNDIRVGLRIVGFKKRVTIAFTVDDQEVTVLRLFYGGRNWEPELT